MSPALIIFLISLLCALGAGWLLVRFEWLHARLSHDHAASGPQKFHVRPTPRIGGVPVALGLTAGFAMAWWLAGVQFGFLAAFALSLLPAYASGLLEDLTKRLGPDMRLWASFLSALVTAALFDVVVQRSGLPFTDRLLSWYPLALGITVVGVGGVAHAVNLIDGYNGLAGVVSTLMHAALAYVCWQVGDAELLSACLAMMGATLGFLVWNFPRGRIFAGDGGAYLWGVSTAVLSVLLIGRHDEVSPWFPFAVVIYPVFETIFTVWRRKMGKAGPAGAPDARHLHQLVYRRVISPPAVRARGDCETLIRRNAMTSPFLWALCAASLLPALLFWRDSAALMGTVFAFGLLYVWLYRSIAGFSTPRLLRRLGRRAGLRTLRRRGRPAHHAHRPA